MFSAEYTYQTKQARGGIITHTRDLDLGLTAGSFRWRAARSFDDLPLEIRNSSDIQESSKGMDQAEHSYNSNSMNSVLVWRAQVYHLPSYFGVEV